MMTEQNTKTRQILIKKQEKKDFFVLATISASLILLGITSILTQNESLFKMTAIASIVWFCFGLWLMAFAMMLDIEEKFGTDW